MNSMGKITKELDYIRKNSPIRPLFFLYFKIKPLKVNRRTDHLDINQN